MGFWYKIPANQLGGLKVIWIFTGYGLSQVWVRTGSTVVKKCKLLKFYLICLSLLN